MTEDEIEKIHIGALIKQKFLESGKSVDDFAAALQCCRTNIYKIFGMESIRTDLLMKISKYLNFNFFALYSKQVRQG